MYNSIINNTSGPQFTFLLIFIDVNGDLKKKTFGNQLTRSKRQDKMLRKCAKNALL